MNPIRKLYSKSMATNLTEKMTPTKIKKAAKADSFAVFKTGGKQYRVAVGDMLKIEKIKGEHNIGDKIEFDEVLMTEKDGKTTIGTPMISGAKVKAEIKDIARHKKVVVMRYIQKSRSGPKKNGHKQPYFQVEILAIA